MSVTKMGDFRGGTDDDPPPPHSIEAEQQLLGALLCNNDLLDRVHGRLSEDHFFDPVHARIFVHISESVGRGRLASPVTLKSVFAADDGIKELGGPVYFARLAGCAIHQSQIGHYADHIIEMSERRRLLGVIMAGEADLRSGMDAAHVIESLEAEVLKSTGAAKPRSMTLLAASTKAISEMNERYQNGASGIPSGIPSLDRLTGGLHRTEFTLIGGATSMGKSAVGTFIAHEVARSGVGVGFATLEMGESQIYQRINAIGSLVPYETQRGALEEGDFRRVIATTKDQSELPIEFFNAETRTIHGIFSEARKLQRKWVPNEKFKGLGLLVIDYIQLIKGQAGATSLEILAEAAIECKSIAKRLDIPVIALAQVNRSIGKRDNKVPSLDDLRGSGDLEFAADNVIFCHRPEYYLERELQSGSLKDEERFELEAALTACRGKMDIYVAKQRMGSIGHCRVGCDMATNRIFGGHQL